jgi:uncharacterized protein with HEPN domain
MQLEARKNLEDVRSAGALVQEFVKGCDFDSYVSDRMRRAAVERQFEIMGEALNRLSSTAPQVAERISNCQRVIGFRNILIHGYDAVDDAIVWDIIRTYLPLLQNEVEGLLDLELPTS